MREYDDILAQVPEARANPNRARSQDIFLADLEELKTQPRYRESLTKLLASSKPNKRILGYLTIAATTDTSFNKILLPLLKSEPNDEARHHAARALLYLRDDHAGDLFDYLIKFEDLRESDLIVLYLRLEKTALRETATKKIRSRNLKAKVLALQTLSVCGLNPETDKRIREALTDSRPLVQEYALTAPFEGTSIDVHGTGVTLKGVSELQGMALTKLNVWQPTRMTAREAQSIKAMFPSLDRKDLIAHVLR